ncbi:MAG: hypothetical protein LIR50_11685 [Bacillota bacterium]|nr:hypothetical protein [Bacillota bacterium]
MSNYGYDAGYILAEEIPNGRLDRICLAHTEAFTGAEINDYLYECTFTAPDSEFLYAIISFYCVNDGTNNTNFEIKNIKLEAIQYDN